MFGRECEKWEKFFYSRVRSTDGVRVTPKSEDSSDVYTAPRLRPDGCMALQKA